MNPAPSTPVRQLLVAQLHDLLSRLAEQPASAETVAVGDDLWEAYLSVSPRQRAIPESEALVRDKSSPDMISATLEALAAGRVMTAKELARTTGYSYSSRYRACLTDLARRGQIIRTPDGYRVS